MLTSLPDLIHLVRPRKRIVPFRVQHPNIREQPCTLFLGELGVERVDGDGERAAVCFEGEDAVHDLSGRAADLGGAEVVEVFEVGFVESVADDFDVEVVKVGGGEAVAEVRGCGGQVRFTGYFFSCGEKVPYREASRRARSDKAPPRLSQHTAQASYQTPRADDTFRAAHACRVHGACR